MIEDLLTPMQQRIERVVTNDLGYAQMLHPDVNRRGRYICSSQLELRAHLLQMDYLIGALPEYKQPPKADPCSNFAAA